MTTTRRIRVAFALADLHGGGAQRVVLRLVERLDRARFEPCLIVIESTGAFLGRVPGDVRLLDCGRYAAGGRLAWFLRLSRFLRREPLDLVVSFLWFTNACCLLARRLSRRALPLIASERVSLEDATEGMVNDVARGVVTRLLYPRADLLLANSEALADQLALAVSVPRARIVAIPNPVDVENVRRLAAPAGSGSRSPGDGLPLVVGMGRLVSQKGFDLAIHALALCARPFRLRLLGEGGGRARLASLAEDLGVADRLELPGFADNPFPALAQADLFVLPSRFEGFPNALVEAMALGVPCIASRCPTGPEEIIRDPETGVLVPVGDAPALARAIDDLLADPERRARLALAAARRAEEFSVDRVVPRFQTLLERAAG